MSGLYMPGSGRVTSNTRVVSPLKVDNLTDIQDHLRDAALPHFVMPFPVQTKAGKVDYVMRSKHFCHTIYQLSTNTSTDSNAYSDAMDKFEPLFKQL